MPHARLKHSTRGTLEFRTGQQDEWERQAVASVTAQLADERAPLVHTETRESTRTVRGTVTGLRRKRNSSATDAVQALANYADLLESHVDEFQGNHTTSNPGYTFEGDRLNQDRNAVLESIEWSLTPGRVYELDYEATVRIGQGTLSTRQRTTRDPTVKTGQTPMLVVDGNDLAGMRDYQVSRSLGMETNAVFDRDSAENNDIVMEEGAQQTISFEGVHSGTLSARRSIDSTLDALVGSRNAVTLKTRFPGYDLEVFVTAYQSTLEQDTGGNSHRYRIEMVEGRRA